VSPQRLETGHGSEQDDCWALGVIVYEMMAGRRPHSASEDPQHRYAALSRAIRSNAPREPLPLECPAALAAIVDKLLNVRESARYASAAAVRQDFEAFLEGREPDAMAQFYTPATIVRDEGSSTEVLIASAGVPATLPRPLTVTTPLPSGVAVMAAAAPAAAIAAVPPRTSIGRRIVWAALLLIFVAVFTSEAVAWLAMERFRTGVAGLALRDIAAAHEKYDRLRGASPLSMGARVRVDESLARRLVALADGVLADFRQEDSTVAEVQWRQAAMALDWASALLRDRGTLKARLLVCNGHLDRIAAQVKARTSAAEAKTLYTRAIDEFTQAASLDTRSPDPYLGLSRVYIYGLSDVDGGAKAIADAEARGHASGWRDRAQLGDGYLRRADDRRQQAATLDGDARATELEAARADYLQCVASFDPILDKARSRRNRDYCQRRADALVPAPSMEGDVR
jgi:hypothetical protein